jgi:putative hydrolase of the HAD superfamily
VGAPPPTDVSDARSGTCSQSGPSRDVDGIIFDFAGVLSSSPGEAMAAGMAEFDVDPMTFMSIVMGPLHEDGDHPWHELERGRISMDEYLDAIELLWRAEGFDSFPTPPRGGDLMATLRPIPEMIEAARAVRASGYRTAILTNNVREWGSWRAAWDADNLVDVVIDSSEVGLRKPNPDIFELTVQRLGTTVERTLFLDDFPWNIAGAQAFGLQTMHVTDPVAAARDLVARLL